MKTKKQLEIENAYVIIMDVLKNDNVCLVNKTNMKTLQFFNGSGLWIVKDEKGIVTDKRFQFEEAIKGLMEV